MDYYRMLCRIISQPICPNEAKLFNFEIKLLAVNHGRQGLRLHGTVHIVKVFPLFFCQSGVASVHIYFVFIVKII